MTVLRCSSGAEHRAGSVQGEEAGAQQLNSQAVPSEGAGGLEGHTKLPWGTGVKEQLRLPTSEGCSFPAQGRLPAVLLQDVPLR